MDKVVSFVVPAYNSGNYLRKCLDSFLDKKVSDRIEVIVVNDGSSDETGQIGEEYRQRYPSVFSVIHKENGGHGSAINVGMEAAVGRYVKIIDSDDWVNGRILPQYVKQLSETEAEVVVTPYYTVEMGGGLKSYFPIDHGLCGKEITMQMVIDHWAAVQNGFTFHGITYRRTFYLDKGHHLLENVFYEDHQYATIPCCFAKVVLALNLPIYMYQVGNGCQSVSLSNQVKRSSHLKAVIRQMEKSYLKNGASLGDAGRSYYLKKLETVINTYYKILCLAEPDKGKGRRLAKIEDCILKQKVPGLWGENHRKYLLFILMSHMRLSPGCYEKILRLPIYKKLKSNHG